jgi:hypothetical protein
MKHPGMTARILAIELLGAVINRARQGALHHVNVMADLGQVDRLLGGRRRRAAPGPEPRSCAGG